jgi:hypothetical protein
VIDSFLFGQPVNKRRFHLHRISCSAPAVRTIQIQWQEKHVDNPFI